MKNYSGPIFIIIAALLWAFDGLIRQHLYTLPPITIIFFEHLIGFLLLYPFVFKLVFKTKLTNREWWLVALVAVLSGLLGTLWFTTALGKVHFISISVVFLLQKLQPIFAITTASIFLKEKLDKRYIKWAILALLSAYFVTFKNGVVNLETGEGTAIAALYALLAAMAWGSSTTFSKMLLGKVDSKVSTFYRFLVTTVIALPLMLILGKTGEGAIALPNTSQFGLLGLIAVSTGMVALLIYYRGLAKTSVHVSTILELTFPFVAIVLDMVVNNTILGASQWVASFLLVFAIYKIAKLRENISANLV
ncbi:MAG: DMT family transporter [Candidatus Pacebacteria bacterium]|nr:DMT family transporter [Candidatus Paceibacterota bacterium]MBP9839461.1 DMT family transporter [Candidatus Paceibacterota bacterium]